MELCTKCETCVRKCPNEAIYHRWPDKSYSSDEQMILRKELCIGCSVWAANCPQNAIKMIKVRDMVPPERLKIGNKYFLELITE